MKLFKNHGLIGLIEPDDEPRLLLFRFEDWLGELEDIALGRSLDFDLDYLDSSDNSLPPRAVDVVPRPLLFAMR